MNDRPEEEQLDFLASGRDGVRRRRFEDLPAPLGVLRALVAELTQKTRGGTCCSNDLTETRQLARARGLAWKPLVHWLELHGGFCDCEVVLNVGWHLEEMRASTQ